MTLTCPNYPFHTRFTDIVNRTVLVEVNEEGHAIRDIEQFMEDMVGDCPKCMECGAYAEEEASCSE